MDIVYEDKYQRVCFDTAQSIMRFEVFENVGNLRESEYIDYVVKKGAEFIKKYKPQGILVAVQQFSLLFSLKGEQMVQNIIIDAYRMANIKKLAIILPYNMIAQWTIFQMVEKEFEYSFQRRYFIDEQKAMQWLLE